jgi:hypothetical protein
VSATDQFPTPDAGTAAATRAFLTGAGSPLLVLDEVSRPVQHPPSSGLTTTCVAVATELATRLGTARLANLAAQVPDQVLAQLLLSEQAAVINGLSSCGRDNLDEARAEFASAGTSAALVQRRRRELGA